LELDRKEKERTLARKSSKYPARLKFAVLNCQRRSGFGEDKRGGEAFDAQEEGTVEGERELEEKCG